MRKTAVVYARVSTARQAADELPLEGQIEQCRAKAAALDADVLQVFMDPGISGGDEDRPGFQEAILFAELNEVQYFITWSSSRFARDHVVAGFYKRRLEKRGVQYVSCTMSADRSDPAGYLLDSITALFDEMQRKSVAADTKRSMMKNARDGFWNGGVVPFGYAKHPAPQNDKRRVLKPKPEEAWILSQIFQWRVAGYGARTIAGRLNETGTTIRGRRWNASTIAYLLRNPAANGFTVFNRRPSGSDVDNPPERWIRVRSHDPIIDDETWAQVQEMITAESPDYTGSAKSTFLFTGLLRCGHCESGMQIETAKGRSSRYSYYNCATWLRSRGCRSHRRDAFAVDEFLLDVVVNRIFTPANLVGLAQELNAECGRWAAERREKVRVLRGQLNEVQGRYQKLMDILELQGRDAPNLGDFSARLHDLRSRSRVLTEEIARLEVEQPPQLAETDEDLAEIQGVLLDLVKDRGEVVRTRAMLGRLVDSAVIHPERVDIVYKTELLAERQAIPVHSAKKWLRDLDSNQGPSD